MSYLDRLRTARYTSPSGTEFTFEFNDLKRAGGKKTAVHEFPQQDEADVQDLGNAAVRFSIEAYLTGADYDINADSFWDALTEEGPAVLQHPRWGDLSVLPLTYIQGESFVDGMRRAIFTIDFVRVGDVEYPITTVQTEAALEQQLDDSQDSGSDAFGNQFDPESAAETEGAKKSLTDMVNDFSDKISGITAVSENIAEEFSRKVSEFTSTIDTLILTPITMAQSLITLARLPGRTVTKIKAKVDGYGTLIDNLGNDADTEAEAATQFLLYLAALLGLSESTLVGDMTTREEAVSASETLRNALETAIIGIEGIEGNVSGYSAPVDIMALLRDILSQAAAMLLEKSFSLQTERRITLEGDRTPLDLIYELYGDIDHLDEFIEQNRLQGDEIFMIPRGREVAYYV